MQNQNSNLFSSDSDGDDQLFKDTELLNVILKKRKKGKRISEEDRLENIKECLDEGANINAADKNNNTVMHISVKKGYSKIVEFLVQRCARIDIRNSDNITSFELARDHSDQVISNILEKYHQDRSNSIKDDTQQQIPPSQILSGAGHQLTIKSPVLIEKSFTEIEVPPDGNCLFWSVTLAYLIPVMHDDNLFQKRFKNLFGEGEVDKLEQIKLLIQAYYPSVDSNIICKNETLKKLVTEKFRNRVIEEISSKEHQFKEFISINDFLHRKWEGYITNGKFLKTFCIEFNVEINQSQIDINKFKPYKLNEDALKIIDDEFDKISSKDKVKKFKLKAYLECMRDSQAFGGNHEIHAMSQILHSNINVTSKGITQTINNDSTTTCIQLHNNGDMHYNFGLKKDLSLMETFKNNKPQATSTNSDTNDRSQLSHLPVQSSQPNHQLRPLHRRSENKDDLQVVNSRKMKYGSLLSGTYQASGVKSSLHGVVYQLKLLMFFAYRGKEEGYGFRLATEMDEAEKFDDVVFQYMKPKDSELHYRFLQAKHIQVTNEKIHKITAQDLLTESDDKFSMQKYFLSFRRILQKHVFQNGKLQDFIICSNIDFDFDATYDKSNLKKLSHIYFEPIREEDDMLNIGGERYRFVSKKYQEQRKEVVSNLTKLFMQTSEFKKLATALAQHLLRKQTIGLDNVLFKDYQKALVSYVIDIIGNKLKKETFLDGKLDDIRVPGRFRLAFRDAVEKHLQELKEQKERYPEKLTDRDKEILEKENLQPEPPSKRLKITSPVTDPFWNEIGKLSFELSDGFKQVFILDAEPQLNNIEEVSQEFTRLINNKMKDSKKEIHIQQGEKRGNKILNPEISKLAGHILVECNGKVGFSKGFLNGNQLLGNLDDFRTRLMAKLRVKDNKAFQDKLNLYTFKITSFQTCQEVELTNLLKVTHRLPDEQISEEEVEGFMDRLVFAVNQPNEEKLSQLISERIGEEFNLIDADLITNDFQNKMLNWMKIKQGPNQYLSENDIYVFFKEARENIAQLVVIGPTTEYINEIKEAGIRFKFDTLPSELEIFLTSNISTNSIRASVFNFVTPPMATFLGSIKVDQILRQVEEYKRDGSYIFIRLITLLRLETEIIKAFQKQETRLLIVECNIQDKSIDNIYKNLFEIVQHVNKQLLLITPEGDNFNCLINSKDFEVYADNPHFCDLDSFSQRKLLGTGVKFQAQEISLNKLIDDNSSELIDTGTLVQLINKQEIKIGTKLSMSSGYDENYYIGRFFYTEVEIKQNIRRDKAGQTFPDLLVISDKSEDFYQLCRDHQNSNIHWLSSKMGKLIWQRSHGSISKLIEYREYKNVTDNQLGEDDLEYYNNQRKIVIISDTAGMGKSTVVTSLCTKIKAKFHSMWVVRIDLNDYTKVLAIKRDETLEPDSAVNFLAEELLELNRLELSLFKYRCYTTGKVAIFLDGFDEISPTSQGVVIKLLKALEKTYVEKIWVTTRPTMRITLENEFQLFSYSMKPFSDGEKRIFLEKFWKKVLSINEDKRLEIYIDKLLALLATSISDKEREFASIPLQTKMLAEVFQQTQEGQEWMGLEDFLSSPPEEQSPKLPDKFNLLWIYERFVYKKYYDIYGLEKVRPETEAASDLLDESFPQFMEKYKMLALYGLLEEEHLNKLLSQKVIEDIESLISEIKENKRKIGVIKIGIIDQITKENKPQFIHRTFAEYFVAGFLASMLARIEQSVQGQRFLISEILLKPQYNVIRAFLDSWLEKGEIIQESTLTQYGILIADLWKPNTRQSLQDDRCNTILHLASMEHNIYIIHFIFNTLSIQNETLQDLINAEDKDGNTALYTVAENGNLEIIKLLLEKGANIDAERKNIEGNTVLFRAVTGCFRSEVIEFLIQKNANVNAKSEDGNSVLYQAAEKGNLRILKCLLAHGANVNAADLYNITVLHNAIHSSDLEIVKCLIENNAEVTARDEDGNTILHYAAFSGNLEMCEWLVKPKINGGGGCDVYAKTKDGSTILHEAAISGNLKLCKWLVNRGLSSDAKDKGCRTSLHEAAKYGNADIVQRLVEINGTNVNDRDEDGNTVLLEVAKYGNADLCEWFITQTCLDINATDNIGSSMLHIAAKYGNLEVVRWLVKNNANVNAVDNDGNMVIFEPIRYKNNEVEKKYTLKKYSEIHFTIHRDGIRRYTSFTHKPTDEDIIQYLVQSGVNVNVQDKNGRTILHWAADVNWTNLVQWLIKSKDQGGGGSDITVQDENKETALDLAKKLDDTDNYKLLLDAHTKLIIQ